MPKIKLAVIGAPFVLLLLFLDYFPFTIACIAAAMILTALLATLVVGKREWRSTLLLACAGVVFAVLFFGIFTRVHLTPVANIADGEHTFEGTVISHSVDSTSTDVIVKIDAVDGKEIAPKFSVRCSFYGRKQVENYSDIRFSTKISAYENVTGRGWWGRYNISEGIYAYAYPGSYDIIESREHTLEYYAFRVREKFSSIFSSFFEERTLAVVKGITLGDKADFTAAQSVFYSQSGVAHIFAVSGMHVAFVCAAFLGVARLFRIKKRTAFLLTSVAVVCFMTLQGFTPSVTRAGLMFLVIAVGVLIKRDYAILNSITFAAIVIALHNPFVVCDVSFQLSFSAVIGIVLLGPKFCGEINAILDFIHVPQFLGKAVSDILGASLAALLATAPVCIFSFGFIAYMAPLTNLLIIWAVEIVFIFSYLLLIFAKVPFINHLLARIVEVTVDYISTIIEKIAKTFAGETSQSLYVMIAVLAAAVIIVCAELIIGNKKGKKKKAARTAIALALVLAVVIAGLFYSANENKAYTVSGDELLFAAVSVGQGDCLVLIKNEKAVVVDCGTQSGDAAGALRKFLNSVGVDDVEAVIVSHMHNDHVNGVAEIIEYYSVPTLYLPREYALSDFGEEIDKAASKTEIIEVEDDIKLDVFDEVSIYLYTDFADEYDFTNESNYNKAGTVVFVDYGDSEILLCGDITTVTENRLMNLGYNIDTDILKVAHHGSNGSNGEKFLQAVTADIAVISYGKNSYNLPSPKAMERIELYIPQIYTTFDGTVQIVTTGDGLYSVVR